MPLIETIWNSWEEEPCRLTVPENWSVSHYRLPEDDAWSVDAVRAAIASAMRREPVCSRVRAAKSACILVDDITRPACWASPLAVLREELIALGIPPADIRVVVALAGHTRMSDAALAWKLGEHEGANALQHSSNGPFRWIQAGTLKVGLNETYCAADFRAALGSLIPHPFAGFSGGGKAVFPGISDLESVRGNHFLVNFGRGKVADTDNAIRAQMDHVAEISGLDLLINVACNGRREISYVTAGPMREAFAPGVAHARSYYGHRPERPHNILILNGYPKDRELLQVSSALNVVRTLPAEQAARVEAVVLIARLGDGLGHHALFGPGGSLYQLPKTPPYLRGRKLIFHSPVFDAETFYRVFSRDWLLLHNWSEVVRNVEESGCSHFDAGVYHQASMQISC